MSARTILAVEDNAITRKLFRLTLAQEGFTLLDAGDAETALAIAAREPVDLVLQDLFLPDMDGFDLVRRFRAIPALAGTPIVAVSGFLSRLELGRAHAAGFTDYMAKPVEPSRLVSVVRTHLAATRRPAAARGRRVLLVDDDPVQLKVGKLRLAELGFAVTGASDGAEALQLALASPPDAIVSDVLMPRVDGFDLCAQVRRNPRLAAVPVVLVSSAYVDEADRRLAARAGASALVVRTPGLEAALVALDESLGRPPPTPEPMPPEALLLEHRERALAQLEKQAAMNEVFAQRAATNAALLSVIAGIADTLAVRPELDAMSADLLASLMEAGGVSIGALYATTLEGALTLRAQSGFGESTAADAVRLFGHPALFALAMGSRTTLLVPSVDLDPETARDFLARVGAASCLIVPFFSGEERLGAVLLASNRRDLIDPDWVPFARTLAVQVGQALALARAFTRTRESEQRFREVVENAADAILLVGEGGRLTHFNRAAERIFGYTREEVLDGLAAMLVPEEFRVRYPERLQQIAAGRGTVESRGLRKDGTVFPTEIGVVSYVSGAHTVFAVNTRDISERKEAEQRLHQSEERLREFADGVHEAFFITDARTRASLYVSPAWEVIWGQPADVLRQNPNAWFDAIHPEDKPRMGERLARDAQGLSTDRLDHFRIVRPDGSIRWIRVRVNLIRDATGAMSRIAGIAEDITELRKAEEALARSEEQFRQAQKMEAIGQLAGGVAHDFNNMLAAINGYADLILAQLTPGDPMREDVGEIRKAGDRAAVLTRQLLAFSRRQVLQPKVLDLNTVVSGMEKMLRRLIGEDVALSTLLAPDLGRVKADPGQIEQVLLNLSVNARDAMPRGGKLTIESANVELGDEYAHTNAGVAPGRYAMFAVSDNGTGMDAATQARIFEPFFTTKEAGKGTGLGLSTVYGILKQSGGHVAVYSEPGCGTTFKVYLPHVQPGTEEVAAAAPAPAQAQATETILLAEDDATVRALTRRILERSGYTVLDAENGGAALLISERHPGPIQLMISDVVMPNMSGADLAARLAPLRPEMKVLYFSGYTAGVIAHHGVLEAGTNFLEKPFTAESLTRKVREVLAAPRAAKS